MGEGIFIKIDTKEYMFDQDIPSSTTDIAIKTPNIKNDCYVMHFALRLASELVAGDTLDLYDYQDCKQFYFQDGNQITPVTEWIDTTTNNFGMYQINAKAFPKGLVGFKVPSLPFCEEDVVEDSKHNCYGSRFIAGYNNPELRIIFTSATGAAIKCEIIGEIHNMLIYQRG
jgi:hypothetical protein